MEIAKFRGVSRTPEPIDKKFGVGHYVDDDSPHAKIQNCGIVYPVTLPIALHPNPIGKN